MNRRWLLTIRRITSLIVLLGLVLPGSAAAHAQGITPPGREGCVGCHDNLYFLYDTGKWYCQCSSSPDCTSCHGGNPTVMTEKEAHLGMVASPVKNDAEICQSCHPSDYHERVERFAATAGIKPTHPPCPTPTSVEAGIVMGNGAPPSMVAPNPVSVWQISGLAMASLAVIGFFIYFCRCWRQEHMTT